MPPEELDKLEEQPLTAAELEAQAKDGLETETNEEQTEQETPDLEVLTKFKDFVEQAGGEDYIKEAKQLYDTFTATPDKFSPSKFWTHLAETSEQRYDAVVMDIFNTHKDYFTKNVLGIDPTEIDGYRQWRESGKPAAKASSVDEQLDPDDPDYETKKELQDLKKQLSAQQEYQRKQQIEKQQYDNERNQQLAARAEEDFSNTRVSKIEDGIKKLNLGDDELGKRVSKYLSWCSQGEFSANEQAKNMFTAACQHVRVGEKRLAANLEPLIDGQISNALARVAKDLVEMLAAKRELDKTKALKGQERREPAVAGTAPGVTAQKPTGGNVKAFDRSTQINKLRELESSGLFNS